ncbi:MAG TPA: hypothetical protein VM056_00870 [Terriglobales bacterium]|nr:hypothetical protein [Terriglobales bacterium]
MTMLSDAQITTFKLLLIAGTVLVCAWIVAKGEAAKRKGSSRLHTLRDQVSLFLAALMTVGFSFTILRYADEPWVGKSVLLAIPVIVYLLIRTYRQNKT